MRFVRLFVGAFGAAARSYPTRRGIWSAMFCASLAWLVPAQALATPEQYSWRMAVGAGLMVPDYQIKKMLYDQLAMLGDFYAARTFKPWLDARAGLHGATFWRSEGSSRGGLLALTAGGVVQVPRERLTPYAAVDFGVGVTGSVVRPVLTLSVGVDARIASRLKFGPVLGLSRVVQWDDNRYSPDARYFWFGLSIRDRLGKDSPPPAPPPPRYIRIAPEPVAAPEPEVRVETNTIDVTELIERALPTTTKRIELLAPVLFGFDSDALEPIGIAMLHEVVSTLTTRTDIKLVQIQGYADGRGEDAYNAALSARRAERVRAWLVEHGIAPERLTTEAHGESSFVERGSSEGEHEQNRRVIFRVLEAEEP